MYPVHSPECVGGQHRGVVDDMPVLVNDREEAVHLLFHDPVVRRNVVPDVDRLLAIAPAKLRDIRNRDVVERPQSVFVERLDSFFEADLDAVGQERVLAQQVLLLHSSKEVRIVFLANGLDACPL